MKQKIIKTLTNNLGLKLLALVFAFLLWLFVVNLDDPEQKKTFTTVVRVTNEQELNKAGKLYEIKGDNTVSFRVTAKRSIMGKLSTADFDAVADMSKLENNERVPVTISAKSYANSVNIWDKQNYIYVTLEDEKQAKFVIEPKTSGALEPGLDVESTEVSPTVLKVTGREEIVSKIKRVEATADVSGYTTDFTDTVIPKLYDGKGNQIDSDKLSLSVEKVNISVHFMNNKTVDIGVKPSGTLPSGFSSYEIKTEPSSVGIIGEPGDLNDVTSITIPDSVINLSSLTGSFTTTVDITSYLPEGVKLTDGSSSKVTIHVLVDNEAQKSVEVPASNISFTNVSNGHSVSLDGSSVTVNVFGSEEAVKAIEASQIKGTIDCSSLSIGEKQNAVVQFEKTNGVTVQNTSVTVTVIEDKNSTNGEQKSEENED